MLTKPAAAAGLAWTTPELVPLADELGAVATGLGGLFDTVVEASNTSGVSPT